MLGLGERRRSWHESEHSLDRVTEYLPRSRSYEHIDEPFSGDGAEPHTVDDPEDPRLSSDSANQKPQKSRKTRKKTSSSTSKLAKNLEVETKDGESRLEESRLLDIRNHHVPKKLSSLSEGAPHASSTASTSSSSAIRKGSMANIFKGITIPGRDRKGRNSRAEKSSSSPRHKSSSNMPIIHSDTDTDNDQRRMRSSDRNNGVRRNESNSSASISRNNSLKDTKGSDSRPLESGSDFDDSDFEEDPELNAADIPDTWYAYTDQKNNPNVKEKSEMKRQENIYELIYTERNHHRVLKIMQKIFIGQMRKELGFTREKTAKFFPDLDELALISKEFLNRLTKRQEESFASETPVIEKISDILLNFWNSDWGERKAIAYGRLCARQHDSLKLYKEEIKNNKRFNSFIQKYKGKVNNAFARFPINQMRHTSFYRTYR